MSESNGRALVARISGAGDEQRRCSRARVSAIEAAQAELRSATRRWSAGIARGIHGRRGTEDLEDLIQVGMVGLLEAIDRFDPERGAFAPYASVTISGMIKRHLRDRSWRLRFGRSLHDAIQQVGPASAALEAALGRPPSVGEIAEPDRARPRARRRGAAGARCLDAALARGAGRRRAPATGRRPSAS